jgi:outer membrane receptor protein involved in Fe transport
MKARRRAALLLTVASATAFSAPAFAQDAAEADIVVTARRTEERLQDVPISITVFNQQELTNRNVVSAGDLSTYTPSLAANNRFGSESTSFAIRGFTQETNTSPSVAVYFADVIAPRVQGATTSGNGAGPGAFFDLQNVQVLKGPQGTLFGRNTTGGAILLVPQKPTGDFEGYVEGSIGNYDMKRLQAVVNIPMSDVFRMRLGIDRQKRDGYLKNVSPVGPRDFEDVNYTALRFSLAANISEDLENYTVASYTKSDTNGAYPKMFLANATGYRAADYAAQIAATSGGLERQPLCLTRARAVAGHQHHDLDRQRQHHDQEHRELRSVPAERRSEHPWRQRLCARQQSACLQLRHRRHAEAGNQWHVAGDVHRGTAAARARRRRPTDLSGRRVFRAQHAARRIPDDPERLVPAVYRYHQVPVRRRARAIDPQRIRRYARRPGRRLQHLPGEIQLPQSRLLRAGHLQVQRSTEPDCGYPLHFRRDPRARPKLPGILFRAEHADVLVHQSGAAGPGRHFRADHRGPIALQFRAAESSAKPTWLVGLDYKPNDDMLLYAKYSRGYRQGAVNVSSYGLETWGPEQVDTYEIGAKASFDGPVRGNFNIAAFYNDFSNQQLQVGTKSCEAADLLTNPVQCPFAAAPAAGIANTGKSVIKGVEIDARLSPVEGLTFDFGYAYLRQQVEVDRAAAAAGLHRDRRPVRGQ